MLQTLVFDINNAEYAPRFDYWIIRDCLYKTLVYTLVAKYASSCRRKVVVMEDLAAQALLNDSLERDNTDFMFEVLGDERTSETASNLMPIVEIYLDRLFYNKSLYNKCIIIINANVVSDLTSQILFKVLKTAG